MASAVLDASALLALLNAEPGGEQVAEAVAGGAAISAVNLSEVVAKLAEAGMPEPVIHDVLDPLGLAVAAFEVASAYRAGLLRAPTKQAGLSLGDRACLSLAQDLGLPALTADRTWSTLPLGITVRVLR